MPAEIKMNVQGEFLAHCVIVVGWRLNKRAIVLKDYSLSLEGRGPGVRVRKIKGPAISSPSPSPSPARGEGIFAGC
jgi:hypothetical protein